MAKFTIKAQGVEKLMSVGKIRQYLKDHPNSEIGYTKGLPGYLIEEIAKHNSKFTFCNPNAKA